jgi:hypothetical protein
MCRCSIGCGCCTLEALQWAIHTCTTIVHDVVMIKA